MTALAPAFRSMQYGSEGRESLLRWVSDYCKDFREMKFVSYAKYVGTTIGPAGHIHRWMAHRKIIQRVQEINASSKGLVERLCDFKIHAVCVFKLHRIHIGAR